MTPREIVRKRDSHQVSLARTQARRMTHLADRLQKRVWALQQRIQRSKQPGATSTPVTTPVTSPVTSPVTGNHRWELPADATPVKEADQTLRDAGISPSKAGEVRKRLSMSNAMWGVLATKASIALRRSAVAAAARINSARRVAALLKTSRHTEKRDYAQTARKIASNVSRRHIAAFLLEPNNSSCMPGKRDTVTVAGVKLQRYILNDTMYFLHQRYKQEHPQKPVSLRLT